MTDPNMQYNNTPPPPSVELSGGMKAACFFIGFLMGIPGLLVAFVIGNDKPPTIKNGIFKFAVIGLAVSIGISVLVSCLSFFMFAAFSEWLVDFIYYNF